MGDSCDKYGNAFPASSSQVPQVKITKQKSQSRIYSEKVYFVVFYIPLRLKLIWHDVAIAAQVLQYLLCLRITGEDLAPATHVWSILCIQSYFEMMYLSIRYAILKSYKVYNRNSTNHPISSNSHSSVTANKQCTTSKKKGLLF